jgi:hypothetical protein
MKEGLWEELIKNILYDIEHGDCSGLYELLSCLPDDTLNRYLGEEDTLGNK